MSNALVIVFEGINFTPYNEAGRSPGIVGYNRVIDWGDGNIEDIGSGSSQLPSHTYEEEGTYIITISGKLTKIKEYTFYYCYDIISVKIPDTITEIGDYCFHHCINLEKIIIPNSVISIGQYCFVNCFSLKKIKIPNNITEIPKACFQSCGLETIIIPESVTNIKTHAFYWCESAKRIIFKRSTRPILEDSTVFTMTSPSKCRFYVPKGSLSNYTQSSSTYPSPQRYTYIEGDPSTLEGATELLADLLVKNLTDMGVKGADVSDGLTTLANKILEIGGNAL